MKNFKKLAALLLAAVLAVTALTACTVGASMDEAEVEATVMAQINGKRVDKVENDEELKTDAENFLYGAVNLNTGILNVSRSASVERKDNGVIVAKAAFSSNTAKLLDKFFELINNKDQSVEINKVAKWVKVGVSAKTVQGSTYVALVVEIDPNA